MRSCFLVVGDLSYVSVKCHFSSSIIGMEHMVCLDPTLSNIGPVAELFVDCFETSMVPANAFLFCLAISSSLLRGFVMLF